MMPLRMARIGETNCIRKSQVDDVKQRLAELGLVVGREVTLVSEIFGNIMCPLRAAASRLTTAWPTESWFRRNMVWKTLRDAKISETVKVIKLHGEGAVKRRIMDMGVTKGAEIFVRKVAPLRPHRGDGERLRLSIRKADAG